MNTSQPNNPKPGLVRNLLVLAVIGLLAALTLTGVHQLTEQRIVDETQRRALASLQQVLPPEAYNNALIDDYFTARIAGLSGAATIYRARFDGTPVAILADVVTDQGYSGDIRLLIAVDVSGQVRSVRILDHRETPGLGDKIERERSEWITQFAKRSLGDPPRAAWESDQRQGAFDTLSSATITSSAVIRAIRDVLVWYQNEQDEIYALRSEAGDGQIEAKDGRE